MIMMIKMGGCWFQRIHQLRIRIKFSELSIIIHTFIYINELYNNTLASLILLTLFIGTLLSWLVIKTIKEGKEALKEMGRDNI